MPIHVIEELLDALEATDSEEGCEELEPKEIIMAVDQENSDSDQKRRTMRLCGQMGKLHVLMLVDLGSVGTFISSELAKKLPHVLTACCLHQNLGRRMRELEASRVVSLRNRLDVNRYQLI